MAIPLLSLKTLLSYSLKREAVFARECMLILVDVSFSFFFFLFFFFFFFFCCTGGM